MSKCLSVRQPWAWLIVNGWKNVENRTWHTEYRGPILIHAGKTFDRGGYDWVKRNASFVDNLPGLSDFEIGCIVGCVRLCAMVSTYPSVWFEGPCGWLLDMPQAYLVPVPYSGKLGLFEVK